MDFIIESKDYVKRCLTYVRRSYRLSDAEFGHYLENVSHPEPGRKSWVWKLEHLQITKHFLARETAACNLVGHKLLFDNIVRDELFTFVNDYLDKKGVFLRPTEE